MLWECYLRDQNRRAKVIKLRIITFRAKALVLVFFRYSLSFKDRDYLKILSQLLINLAFQFKFREY